jgi:putative hydrolase of the HAD superfamily
MSLRGVLLDLDDTLLVEVGSAEEAFRASGRLAQAEHGVDPEALHRAVRQRCRELWYAHPLHPWAKRIGVSSWEALWARFLGDQPELGVYRAWAPDYRVESWRRGLADLGVDDPALVERLAETFPRERRRRHLLFDDALSALTALRDRGMRLGLVTNGLSCLQREKISGGGLESWFEAVVISGELGIRKPNEAPFLAALGGMGIRPEDAAMVGNSLENDVAGARAAGVRSVWLDRNEGASGPGPEPDARIASLSELPALLDGR